MPKPKAETSFDRLPPHSLEAEQSVLGCLLLWPAGKDVTQERFGGETVFYDLRHQEIYQAMESMWLDDVSLDVVTLNERLRSRNALEAVGGLSYISALPDLVPSAAMLSSYVDIVWEKFMLRKVVHSCTAAVAQIYESEPFRAAGEIVEGIERDIMSLKSVTARKEPGHDIKNLVQGAIEEIELSQRLKGSISGLSTGFPDLDKMTDGFHPGEMIVIAGRPSSGKSAIMMNITEHVALDQNLPVGIFSLEMTARSLVLRTICSRSRVNLRSVRDGFLAERDLPKLTGSAAKISRSKIYIDDTSGLTISQLRTRARKLVLEHGLKLIAIDYLQLVHPNTRYKISGEEAIAEVAYGIKELAKDTNIPVIALAQLNREHEKENREPQVRDLRSSGAIEQAADLIAMLYHPTTDDDEKDSDSAPVNLLIRKQRNGPIGTVHLTFLKAFTRFESAARVSNYEDQQDSLGGL